ncbi:MAG: 50S ribosomal protein L22 [Kiritimatiellae bacterium]|nr:50S ribosomal protein L22 [Kiritimatiellia bacterium]MBP5225892.1 50S ribosomal protein L22 [Kiritimatiellia bacterium]
MSEIKEVTAITRNVRMSAMKGRPLARECQGKSVAEALKVVEFSPRKAAGILKQTIKSAMANATNNAKLDVDTLVVKLCVFDEGTRMRRFWPRARGSASPIARRLCHCKVVLAGLSE